MLIAILGAVRIVLCRHNEDDSFDERLLIVFLAIFLAFTMVFKMVVLGSYDLLAFETAEEAAFAQFFVWLGAWVSTMMLLVFGPMLFMDEKLNFSLTNFWWLKRSVDDLEMQDDGLEHYAVPDCNVVSFKDFIKK